MMIEAVVFVGLGSLLGFGIFLLSRRLNWNLPPGVAIAFGTIIGWLVGKLF